MPLTAVVAELSILPFMGIKSYKFGFDVPVIHVGIPVDEVSLLARLDSPLLHKRLVFLHVTRTCDDLYLCCTYTPWLDSDGQGLSESHSIRCNQRSNGVLT
jgi:hypothetical protein